MRMRHRCLQHRTNPHAVIVGAIGLVAVALVNLLGMSTAPAGTFANAYISFNLPDNWSCALDETEWVCSENGQQMHQSSIIIMAAKEIGPGDSLDAYYDHLARPQMLHGKDGSPLRLSRIEFVKRTTIGGRSWVEGRHYESEVADFYTEYFATVTRNIAVLITFSADRSVFAEALDRFSTTVNSLQVFDPFERR
jgi:hypothetical protein